MFNDLIGTIKRGSKRGQTLSNENLSVNPTPSKIMKLHQPSCTNASSKNSFSQQTAESLFVDLMIDEMLPSRLTDSSAAEKFMHYLNPKFKVPSRKKYMNIIKKQFEVGKAKLNSLLQDIEYVATTADCWSAHNRSFLGMTVHWIKPDTLEREKAVLTCIELSASHTYDGIGGKIHAVHQMYNIDEKVSIAD